MISSCASTSIELLSSESSNEKAPASEALHKYRGFGGLRPQRFHEIKRRTTLKKFNELAKLVKELDGKRIWAYMLEIATVIDGTENLSDEQKQDAYVIASTEFENYDDDTVGANVFAGAAIYTILDERYTDFLRSLSFEYQEDVSGDIVRDAETNLHDLFMEKLSSLLN